MEILQPIRLGAIFLYVNEHNNYTNNNLQLRKTQII